MPRRILVVEDEPDVLESLRDLLEGLPDVAVETARNFTEGTALAGRGGWAAILCDQRLPDGRGVDILAEVAETAPGTLRVLMSAFPDFDVMLRGVNAAHIDHFVQKPWDPEVVLDWLKRALDGERSTPERTGPFRRIGRPTGLALPSGMNLRRV